MHICDNPSCILIQHLSKGTQKENSNDRDLKGRRVNPLGSKHGQSKLTEEQVLEILKLKDTCTQLRISKKYNVSRKCISHIFNGSTWSHLTGIGKL